MNELRQWIGSYDRGWRLFVGFVCSLCVALFLHFREVRVEVLDLHTPASKYIVAQVDFKYPDEQSTALLKERIIEEIGSVLALDKGQIRERRFRYEKDWKPAEGRQIEVWYDAAKQVESEMLLARFADPQTLQRTQRMQIEPLHFHPLQEETLSPVFWEQIAKRASQAYPADVVGDVVAAFATQVWTFSEDQPLVQVLRNQLAQSIPERFTEVAAGTRIIDQGERVTLRHLAMMQSMKQALSDARRLLDPLTLLSDFILAILLVTVTALYFRISQITFIRSLQQVALFVSIIVLSLCLAKVTEYLLLHSSHNLIEEIRYPILAPFATLLICQLLSPRTALFAATVLSIILAVSLAVDYSRFLILNLVTSIAVIIVAKCVRRRTEIFTVCLKSWLAALPVLYAFTLGEGHLWSTAFVVDVGASLAFLMVTAVFAIGILPAFESLFQVLTDTSLMEYMNPSNPLLQRMCLEVPGTYNHSLFLGNLAEGCANAIGANGLFCRVATLYHDIGKLNHPYAFGENQQGGLNLHQLLSPEESARMIISHIPDGVELARHYRLPEPFQDIIREHHGTTLAYYFYRKAKDSGGFVDETAYRYPGPKPRTKESGIIMLCDAIEAASRSPQEEDLEALIDRLVAEKAEEGQLDDCQLTFEELTKVKRTLAQNLQMSHHVRVKYPKKT